MMIIKTKRIEDHIFESDASGKKVILDTGSSKQVAQSPVEVVLSAVASCASIDVIEILRKKRKNVANLEVTTEADRKSADEGHPRIFKAIHLNFSLESENASEKDLKHAIELSVNKYCSVVGMLNKSAKITYAWEVKKV